ncbi:DUF397 domain-containing protein [Actinomadura madurae]|nr:DUF397 domain-containing protein [Actinomadura madurae]MCP9951814.1 DUF397 domain-containing protein [Actinomadura madurae]MCP9968584.1 DUF397 domain-containing protein [Actinomadura madurae]MCP9981058.1 DUF397 domain-containing protein [Actinomadura madurae]MCQ0007445.1 DUF397 domain-containing protein [Actinomadura madurae]MCQ0017251.1 DUF397 domain-containing protein [Actinomadura madurae]
MTTWRKSSRSGTSGQSDCVEVAELSGNIGVRDSKHPDGPKLTLTATSFRQLATNIKRGTHDLP